MVESLAQLRAAINSMDTIDGPDFIVLSADLVYDISERHIWSGSTSTGKEIHDLVLTADEQKSYDPDGKTGTWSDNTSSCVGALMATMSGCVSQERTFALNATQVPEFILAMIYPKHAYTAMMRILGREDE